MRVVFDTNVYVSAFAIPGGAAERAVRIGIDGAFELAISRPILDELLGVLSRKLAREAEELAQTAIFLTSLAELAVPTQRVHVLLQDADNRILECALAAGADVIVTGDREILSLRTWQGIEILSLRQFFERFGLEAMQSRAPYRVASRVGEDGTAELSAQDLAFLGKLLNKRHQVALKAKEPQSRLIIERPWKNSPSTPASSRLSTARTSTPTRSSRSSS